MDLPDLQGFLDRPMITEYNSETGFQGVGGLEGTWYCSLVHVVQTLSLNITFGGVKGKTRGQAWPYSTTKIKGQDWGEYQLMCTKYYQISAVWYHPWKLCQIASKDPREENWGGIFLGANSFQFKINKSQSQAFQGGVPLKRGHCWWQSSSELSLRLHLL